MQVVVTEGMAARPRHEELWHVGDQYPDLTDDEFSCVCEAIQKCLLKHGSLWRPSACGAEGEGDFLVVEDCWADRTQKVSVSPGVVTHQVLADLRRVLNEGNPLWRIVIARSPYTPYALWVYPDQIEVDAPPYSSVAESRQVLAIWSDPEVGPAMHLRRLRSSAAKRTEAAQQLPSSQVPGDVLCVVEEEFEGCMVATEQLFRATGTEGALRICTSMLQAFVPVYERMNPSEETTRRVAHALHGASDAGARPPECVVELPATTTPGSDSFACAVEAVSEAALCPFGSPSVLCTVSIGHLITAWAAHLWGTAFPEDWGKYYAEMARGDEAREPQLLHWYSAMMGYPDAVAVVEAKWLQLAELFETAVSRPNTEC